MWFDRCNVHVLKQLSVLNTYFERSAFHVILSNLSGVVNTSSNQFHNS